MPADRPNVLFLLSDQHSFRFLGCLDDEVGEPVRTPALDGLAESGTIFEEAYCQVPLCTPSRICLLTGLAAHHCGAWANGHMVDEGDRTVAEAFSAAGYETALLGKMHLGGDRQFVGFDRRPYGDLTGENGHQPEPVVSGEKDGFSDKRSRLTEAGPTEVPESHLQEEQVARETLAFAREQARGDDPWFACASFSRPHFPLTAPRRYFERYWDPEADEPTDRLTAPKVGHEGDTTDHPLAEHARKRARVPDVSEHELLRARAGYFACVDYLDDAIGDLLALLERDGLLDDTIVVYTSDHGELAGEHGLMMKRTWHEASTHVPWLVQTPEHRAGDDPGGRVETPVSLADLFPTLAGLAGVDAPADLDGTDLSAAVATGAEPDRGPVFCDYLLDAERVHVPGVEYRMVRDGKWKYVGFHDAPELLFDLEADPLEQENLAPDAEGEDREALERLRALVAETMDFEAAFEERARDTERAFEERALDVPESTSGNAYLLPDGRVVDADTPLYEPRVFTDDPGETFADWPGEN